ncbi:RNA 2',3'-cyclic phosphodiesterase [Pseudonocardia eucalypti]|uniref:RNA 2',3'-cyclic phosphodiesterase n=1 Tax=Pseudonocardia eucalypti TaxID=648755 RepID=A0ABP9PXD2_9PSEU|nr:2'-5' RNA ligase [Pseudonocardia eucalypti]
MRLFVALNPPAEVVEQLRAAIRPLAESTSGPVRWARPDQWHLTLAFLGEVDDAARADPTTRLARVASRAAPPALSVAGAGRFGHRVLWAGLHGDIPDLRRMAASVRAAARRAGLLKPDARPYRPHLTLARSAGGTDLRPLAAALDGFTSSPWTAEELLLVRSRLGAGPGRSSDYDTVGSWPLGGRGAQVRP